VFQKREKRNFDKNFEKIEFHPTEVQNIKSKKENLQVNVQNFDLIS